MLDYLPPLATVCSIGMAGNNPENGASLPFAALQLLAPPVRLVSAALWKVIKQRDVMHYGALEEFVTSACETVPGLLTVRHQGKLALGLRGRLILELCRKQLDEETITSHLERIRVPAAMSASGPVKKKDVKIQRTVESFHSLVRTLLTDAAERELFFKEEFPEEYGARFDQELENLLWEFLIRLDQLLPVPSLTRTVSWLSEAPPVLEECARAATQPQLLKILLQHQMCLGHLEAAASLPPNMGDSILDSLSLPPSGKAASKEPTGAKMADAGPSDDTQTWAETPFIKPVIGLISNEDVPMMFLANKSRCRDGGGSEAGGEQAEERKVPKPSGGKKRKQPDRSESDEDAEVDSKVTPEDQGSRSSTGSFASALKLDTKSDEDTRTMSSKRTDVEVKPLHQDLSFHFVSSLNRQPIILLDRLPAPLDSSSQSSGGPKSPHAQWPPQRRHQPPSKPHSASPASDNKENRPSLASLSSSSPQQRSNGTETPMLSGDGEDYVADSEDEATKNFKDRLFMKRYCRTKHGTYVPTLREHFRPRMARRDLLWTGGKRR